MASYSIKICALPAVFVPCGHVCGPLHVAKLAGGEKLFDVLIIADAGTVTKSGTHVKIGLPVYAVFVIKHLAEKCAFPVFRIILLEFGLFERGKKIFSVFPKSASFLS